jgi:hypothetical protein
MDVLVRLATEPPDLTGVPDELAGLVGSCLERVPRARPTDASILAALGPFDHHPADPGHSYLPDSAMALIGEYQRSPAPSANGTTGADEDRDDTDEDDPVGSRTDGSGAAEASVASVAGEDATAGSHTALPGFESPAALRAAQEAPAPAAPATLPTPPPGRRRAVPGPAWDMRPLAWAGWMVTAITLVAAGTVVGIALRPSGGGPPGPPPSSVGPPPSLCTGTQEASTTPQLCVSQPFGDGDSVFVIHGTGFPQFRPVTVRLADVGTSSDHPVSDMQGTFNYAIDQGHRFFTREIPPGDYTVVATAPGGYSASVTFVVNPALGPPPGPPPGAPPPAGQGAPQ